MTERTALQAACPLEEGAASEGSTCGVVSGGCLAIAQGHIGDMLNSEAGKGEALYGRMREYTTWFEDQFDSTLCRERCGVDVNRVSGFLNYLFSGKVFSRCVVHIGRAASQLVGMVDRPLEGGGGVTGLGEKLSTSGGYCASEVMRGIREATGYGSLYLEQLSVAFDGGIGLSGGLCGALAGALMPMGLIWGIEPRSAGLVGTLVPFVKGHVNLYLARREPELWSIGNAFMRDFKREFGSLECRDIIGRSFETGEELAEFVPASSTCAEIKDWCREEAIGLIAYNTV